MKQSDFCHLHLHTGYSLLDSMIRIDKLADQIAEYGQTACAITDHGTLAGTVKFTDAMRKRGVKPILGQEFYVAPDSRYRKKYPNDPITKKQAHSASHLILLAQNEIGWKNLKTLSTLAFIEGFYKKPRIDHELLARYSEGLIASTACMGGDITIHLKTGLDADGEGKVEFNPDLASAKLDWYVSIFGSNFWIELQEHFDETQTAINNWYRARYPSSMIYASADCHYIGADDYDTHDTLIASASVSKKEDPERWRFPTDQCYVRSTEEMAELFSEEELTNTMKIADSVDFILPLRKQFYMPELPKDICGEHSANAKFRIECHAGLQERLNLSESDYQKMLDSGDAYSGRIEFEMEVFEKAGFVGYALVLWDLIRWCKENSIFSGDGRGSAAGSLVLYALGITGVDPIKRDCPFERFINPGRLENFAPPDVDLDFPQSRRQEVLAFLRSRYGEDRVCQIGTYATLGVAALVKKLAPVLSIDPGTVNKIAATIPQGDSFQGKGPAGDIKGLSLDDIWRQSGAFQEIINKMGDNGKWLLHYARGLQELGSHASTHASGVIVTNRPVVDIVPLMVAKAGTAKEITLAQMDMFDVELLGLIKFDILGLKTLDVLSTVEQLVRDNDDADFTFDKIDLDDPLTYDLLRSGNNVGIFQAEGEGFGRLIPQAQPRTVEDLAVLTSLCRPGPSLAGLTASYLRRRQGIEAVTYSIPQLEPILKKNLGILCFQEDIMNIAHRLAGFTLSEADDLRKVIGKKQKDKMPYFRTKFIDGLEEVSSISPHEGEKLWDQIVPMAEYVFNRSHAMAYSYTTAKCAYAKAHYPAYFLSAAMTAEITSGTGDQLPTLVRDATRVGCRLIAPDINKSKSGFSATDRKTILLGIKSVKGVGDTAADAIIEERDEEGKFHSEADLRARIAPRQANSAVLTALRQSGAFRNIGGPSHSESNDRLEEEFELFGFYLSGHTCGKNRDKWKAECPDLVTLKEITDDTKKERTFFHTKYGRKQIFQFGEKHARVVVTKIDKKKSRRDGTFMNFMELEDETGSMKMILSAKTAQKFGNPEIKKGTVLDLLARKESGDYEGYLKPLSITIL